METVMTRMWKTDKVKKALEDATGRTVEVFEHGG